MEKSRTVPKKFTGVGGYSPVRFCILGLTLGARKGDPLHYLKCVSACWSSSLVV